MTTDVIPIPYLQTLLEEVAKDYGYKKPRYEVSKGSEVGDNYVGVLYRVVLTDADENDDVPLNLIFKAMPQSAKRREAFKVNNFFINEANVYNIVLPTFAQIMQEKGLLKPNRVYPGTPRCYVAKVGDGPEGEDTLVLEDMRPLGFVMHDRRKGLDADHCLLVMHALARLHAASFALEQLRPDEHKKVLEAVQENLFYRDNPIEKDMNTMVERTYDFIIDKFPEGSKEYGKLKKFLDDYMGNMCDLVTPDPEGGNVICHGDCWINNLLFKYNESTKKVEDVCMLDFQIARYASPVLDLAYLFYTCTVKEMRDAHMDRLIHAYHDKLSDTLRALGGNPEKAYPWSRLESQIKRFSKYGLGMALMTIPLFLAESDEIPDMDAEFEKGTDIKEVFKNFNQKSATVRNKRIQDVLEHTVACGYL